MHVERPHFNSKSFFYPILFPGPLKILITVVPTSMTPDFLTHSSSQESTAFTARACRNESFQSFGRGIPIPHGTGRWMVFTFHRRWIARHRIAGLKQALCGDGSETAMPWCWWHWDWLGSFVALWVCLCWFSLQRVVGLLSIRSIVELQWPNFSYYFIFVQIR